VGGGRSQRYDGHVAVSTVGVTACQASIGRGSNVTRIRMMRLSSTWLQLYNRHGTRCCGPQLKPRQHVRSVDPTMDHVDLFGHREHAAEAGKGVLDTVGSPKGADEIDVWMEKGTHPLDVVALPRSEVGRCDVFGGHRSSHATIFTSGTDNRILSSRSRIRLRAPEQFSRVLRATTGWVSKAVRLKDGLSAGAAADGDPTRPHPARR